MPVLHRFSKHLGGCALEWEKVRGTNCRCVSAWPNHCHVLLRPLALFVEAVTTPAISFFCVSHTGLSCWSHELFPLKEDRVQLWTAPSLSFFIGPEGFSLPVSSARSLRWSTSLGTDADPPRGDRRYWRSRFIWLKWSLLTVNTMEGELI